MMRRNLGAAEDAPRGSVQGCVPASAANARTSLATKSRAVYAKSDIVSVRLIARRREGNIEVEYRIASAQR